MKKCEALIIVRVKFYFKKDKKEYIKKKKNIDLPQLVQIYWDITYKCPLSCKHCYAKPQRSLDNELNTDEVKKVIDYLSENQINLVTFSGGEPLYRNDILDILAYAKQKSLHISVITSGLFPSKIKELSNLGLKRIQFSLDSYDEEKYDKLRGYKGLYKKLLKSISNSIEVGIRTSICTTITKDNYNEIPEIFDLALSMGVDEYRLMRLMPCGIAKEKYNQLSITFDDYEKLIGLLCKKYLAIEKPLLIDVEEPYYLIKKLNETEVSKLIYYRSCLQGEAICSLSADGKIIPCPIGNFKEFIAGDIRKDNLLKIWNESPIFKYFRNVDLIDICNSCEYGNICNGGCRCAAFGHYHKLDAADPMCPLSPL